MLEEDIEAKGKQRLNCSLSRGFQADRRLRERHHVTKANDAISDTADYRLCIREVARGRNNGKTG